ncbi:MAG: hypothetical protein U5J63_13100 [Fodinibius sp.]|nr:hypothetical protein [Fodinibius sp.]
MSSTVSADPSDGGTVTPPGGTFAEGEEVSVEAQAAEGWEFVGWTGDVESTENPVDITMNSDKTLTANFEQKEYELTVTADPSGWRLLLIRLEEPTSTE